LWDSRALALTIVLCRMSSSLHATMNPQRDRIVFVDDLQVECLQYNFPEEHSKVLSSLRVFDPDYTEGVLDRLARQGQEFTVRVQLLAHHGVFQVLPPSPLTGDECFIMPPSRVMQDVERIAWGYHCATFYDDVSVSVWANMTLFRPDCPEGWTGLGTPMFPCLKLSLKSIALTLTPYNDALLPLGQSQVPSRTIEMEGTLDDLERVLHNFLQYVPERDFNTVNLGGEHVVVRTNDLGMYNGEPVEQQASIIFFIEAVNDRPNITFTSRAYEMLEDTSISLLGIELRDDDINELSCPFEPCASGAGTLQLKVRVSNGTVFTSGVAATVKLYEILMNVFGSVSRRPRVHECLMRMSCTPNGGFLTLATSTIEDICGQTVSFRCKAVLQYCALAELALSDVQMGECQQVFAEEDLVLANIPVLEDLDIQAMSSFKQVTDFGRVVEIARDGFLVLVGPLAELQRILDQGVLKYEPVQYLNGNQVVEFTVHDQGNVGVGFPCDAPPDIPNDLLFQYCKEKLPVTFLDTTQTVTVTIQPVNNLPEFEVYDEDGWSRIETNSLTAVQNVTKRLNRMFVFDPDIDETSGCDMKVDMTSRSGGILFFNTSLSPLLMYTPSPTLTSLSGEGTLNEINTLMANINYRSDPQFFGLEDVVIDISDRGCTGMANAEQQVVTVIISILVNPPDTCQFETCGACTQQTVEICGWCPASCKGSGKCRNAEFRGGPPSQGECAALCSLGACMAWNMCSPAGDRSWQFGAIAGPLLLATFLHVYFVNMWARRVHGTISIYAARLWRIAGGVASKLVIAPRAGSKISHTFSGSLDCGVCGFSCPWHANREYRRHLFSGGSIILFPSYRCVQGHFPTSSRQDTS